MPSNSEDIYAVYATGPDGERTCLMCHDGLLVAASMAGYWRENPAECVDMVRSKRGLPEGAPPPPGPFAVAVRRAAVGGEVG